MIKLDIRKYFLLIKESDTASHSFALYEQASAVVVKFNCWRY